MSLTKENLFKGERIVYTTSLHWIIFAESIGYLLLGLVILYYRSKYIEFLGSVSTLISYLSYAVIFFGLFRFLLELIRLRSSVFVVSTQRIIIRVGVLKRTSTAMPLSKIESIEIDQTILGRMLDYGSIHITGTGTAESKFDLINNPYRFRRKIDIAAGSGKEIEASTDTKYRPRRRRRRRRR